MTGGGPGYGRTVAGPDEGRNGAPDDGAGTGADTGVGKGAETGAAIGAETGPAESSSEPMPASPVGVVSR